MDRQIIYPGAIPLETDLLKTNKNALVGIGKLAESLLGQASRFTGFSVTPTPVPSLSVVVGPGTVYAMSTVDAAAYSSLPADSHPLLKQGLLQSSVTLNLAPPLTPGQAIVYLVQASLSEIDTDGTVLPYYNSSNPSQTLFGPGGDGTAQPTVRKCVATISTIAGSPAASTGLDVFVASGGTSGGGFTAPAPSAGAVGVALVIVRYGDTAINSASIIDLTSSEVPKLTDLAPLDSPNFTGTPKAPTQPASDNSSRLATTAFVQQLVGLIAGAIPAATPPGTVSAYAGATAPAGYLVCDGSAISRSTYSALFAAIGTTYGVGNGSTTFNVPDLRGEFIRGLDGGRGIDTGRALGSAQSDALKEHQHEFGGDDQLRAQGSYTSVGGFPYDATSVTSGSGQRLLTKTATAYPMGTETRPRNVAMNYIIKT